MLYISNRLLYSKLQALKFLEKLHIGAGSNSEKFVDERILQNGLEDNSRRKEAANGTCSPRFSMQSVSHIRSFDAGNNSVDAMQGTSDVAKRKHTNIHRNLFFDNESSSAEAFSGANLGCFEVQRHADQLPRTNLQLDGNKSAANSPKMKSLNLEDASNGQSDSQKNPGSADSTGSGHGSSSSKGENDLPLVVSSAIQWEDLQFKEEIGHGKVITKIVLEANVFNVK